MTIEIDSASLERACKEIIETILFCLPNAHKGTVYRIGKPPEMIAERITSGVLDGNRRRISWGLPQKSDYNPPGKAWKDYVDQPGRPLEAMAWCVERQKSWTAEDPKTDTRSVRLQVEGVWEDFHHMEPVLVPKQDLYLNGQPSLRYPRDSHGKILWHDSEYAVVAVIKIHFKPRAIRIGSPETRIIKRLSRTLGTDLLSLQLREQSIEAMRQLTEDKLHSCNILADTLRNTLAKSGLIFSLIKLELGSLRAQWERRVLEHSGQKDLRQEAIRALNALLEAQEEAPEDLQAPLRAAHDNFLRLNLPPGAGENWIRMRIEEPWVALSDRAALDGRIQSEIREQIQALKRSLELGRDPAIVDECPGLPEPLKQEWVGLIYQDLDRVDSVFLERLCEVLRNPALGLPGQEKARQSLMRLKALAETMTELEKHTNVILSELLNGNGLHPVRVPPP